MATVKKLSRLSKPTSIYKSQSTDANNVSINKRRHKIL